MLNPLSLLPLHLILYLLFRPQLLLHEFPLLLILRLHLLTPDHLLQRVVLERLLVLHHMHKVLLLHLLLLHLLRLPPHLVLHLSPLCLHIRLVLLLNRQVHRLSHRLLLLLLSRDRIPLRLLIHVPLTRNQYVSCTLLSLIELLPSLNFKFMKNLILFVPLA